MERVRVSAETAVQIIKNGGMLILTDDETRENEGDLVVASEFITAEHINFMAKYGKGLICVSLPAERCDELQLSAMVQENTCKFGTAFTVSVEAREGVTTGISAYDRAVTIKTLINPNATFRDIVTPGHMFPLRAKKGGVLVRAGQTEGSYDLARMAGLYPSGVICEIMDDDGSMARMPRLVEFAKEHNIIFHTDSVQAIGSVEIDVEKLNIDSLSLSAHKFYGPKGIGVLYVKKGIKFNKFINGGHQEKNKRAGTENVVGIVGLSKAMELAYRDLEEHNKKIKELRDYYVSQVKEKIPYIKINGDMEKRLPGNSNISFRFIEGV